MAFTVVSNSFKDGDYLRSDFILSADFGFGCAGNNKSPHLRWSDVAGGDQKLRGDLLRPDAPTGSGFWHWLVVNIPASASELEEGAGTAGGRLPARRAADAYRFRGAGLWRAMSAGRRSSTPLSVHRVRREGR